MERCRSFSLRGVQCPYKWFAARQVAGAQQKTRPCGVQGRVQRGVSMRTSTRQLLGLGRRGRGSRNAFDANRHGSGAARGHGSTAARGDRSAAGRGHRRTAGGDRGRSAAARGRSATTTVPLDLDLLRPARRLAAATDRGRSGARRSRGGATALARAVEEQAGVSRAARQDERDRGHRGHQHRTQHSQSPQCVIHFGTPDPPTLRTGRSADSIWQTLPDR
jgi:hypothetical protein